MFNALELMHNGSVFSALNFAPGDGTLNYYLYNYALNEFPGGQNALVLF